MLKSRGRSLGVQGDGHGGSHGIGTGGFLRTVQRHGDGDRSGNDHGEAGEQ